ncbi:MAG: ATP-binding cassette domain-containing protein [Eubacterium sp.]|nr:ATP-binding cassette domain-containing protein [Eubacterium sp.]
MAILTVKDLNFTYALGTGPSLSDISFSLDEGDFCVICGATGSGKSTLLKMLKRELTPMGDLTGEICIDGTPVQELDDRTAASSVGFVMQRPEQQLVTDKVWHELAFGLENLGVPTSVIHRRVAEMASYFGIEDWFEKPVDDLSGGQKQLLNLASIMVMQPRILILDEPTSQLDPVAASDFIATVGRLNREMGLTVLIVEHRLEEAIPIANRMMAIEKGRIISFDNPRKVCDTLSTKPDLLLAMPAAVRIYNSFNTGDDCPLTVQEGSRWIRKHFKNDIKALPEEPYTHSDVPALEFDDVWFRYGRNTPDILKGTTLTVYEHEIFCILGGNGSGKTTAVSNAAALLKPYSGKIRVFGKELKDYKGQELYKNCLTLLPQDVQTVFLRNTVKEELEDAKASADMLPYDLTPLLDHHPYDLSGGEQQLLALAKALASRPKLLLLDEPTKGLDSYARNGIVSILKNLRDEGMTLVIVTHDVEFASLIADRCAMFFRGEITSLDTPHTFFAENNFYTTAVNRMTRGFYEKCITVHDAVALARMQEGGA